MTKRSLLFSGFAFLIAVACGAGCDASRNANPSTLVAIPTLREDLGGTPEACGAATIEGRLILEDTWGIAIEEHPTGMVREVFWPYGYVARLDGDRLVVVNADGEVVAGVGDNVELGGGEIDGDAWSACGSVTTRK